MTRKAAMALARRIEREDRLDHGDSRIEAIEAQIGRDTGYYVVAILFGGTDAALIIRYASEWEFLRRLRDMSQEEREAVREMKRQEREKLVI